MPETTDTVSQVVVLMMENRSFDSMLGFLKQEKPELEGLKGNEAIPADPTLPPEKTGQVTVSKHAGSEAYIFAPDPGHEYQDVNLQLFGQPEEPAGAVPRNDGFVLSYSRSPDDSGHPIGIQGAKKIMKCFDPVPQLPVLSALAENFVVCDHWFCSVPGPTWPNRFFVHAATSGGHVDSPESLEAVRNELGFGTYGMRTIYENLNDKDLDWSIYYHDFPQTLAFTNLHHYQDNFLSFDTFLDDARNGELPAYSFIEPAYFHQEVANDEHPPHDVRNGEALIADVYNAIRQGRQWRTTLLIVLYDEHGGFYDHVPPPRAINPDGKVSSTPRFDFTRLGVRVPALLVSPLVPKGLIDHTIYDHTSIPATVKKLFELPTFLTRRDATANTFEHHLTGTFREDTPPQLTPPPKPLTEALTAEAVGAKEPLSKYQQSLLALAAMINIPKIPITPQESLQHLKDQLQQFFKK